MVEVQFISTNQESHQEENKQNISVKKEQKVILNHSQIISGGEGDSQTPSAGKGNGIDSSSISNPDTLLLIKQKILKARIYPLAAQERHVEGVVKVSFEIGADGALKSAHILQSSGSSLLDSEALDTLKRAAPYPYYGAPIQLAITFTL